MSYGDPSLGIAGIQPNMFPRMGGPVVCDCCGAKHYVPGQIVIPPCAEQDRKVYLKLCWPCREKILVDPSLPKPNEPRPVVLKCYGYIDGWTGCGMTTKPMWYRPSPRFVLRCDAHVPRGEDGLPLQGWIDP